MTAASLRRVLALLSLLPAAAAAQWAGWDYDFDREIKPWSEIAAQIPAYPREQNLLPFDAGAATPHRYYIDAASLSVGEDGVVRYTLVIKAAGGATNVSFEGIRCETREQKYYAIGRADGSWSRARNPQWKRIEYQHFNRYHGVLYAEYFCPDRRTPASVRQALETLKRGYSREGSGGV
jgi:hypothetical protein